MAHKFKNKNGYVILEVDYLLNEVHNKAILAELDELLLDEKKCIVVDLAKLDYINSMGLNFLIGILTKTRNAGGETVIININGQVSKLLVVTKLKDVFTVRETIEEAKEVFLSLS